MLKIVWRGKPVYVIRRTPDMLAALAKGDPFAGVSENPASGESPSGDFFSDNFGFRKELMSQFSADDRGASASRQSTHAGPQSSPGTQTQPWKSSNIQRP